MSEGTSGSKKPKKEKAPSAAQIQEDLEARRARLADTVDDLTAQLDPRQNLAELKSQLAQTAANASEEAQEFAVRLQSGDRAEAEAIAFTAVAIAAVVGMILIRRGR